MGSQSTNNQRNRSRRLAAKPVFVLYKYTREPVSFNSWQAAPRASRSLVYSRSAVFHKLHT